jgi:ribosomal protein S18 acetylase RimI-like enzyme
VANGALVVALRLAPTVPGAIGWLRRRLARVPAREEPVIQTAGEASPESLAKLVPGKAWGEWLADPTVVVVCLWAGRELAGVGAGQLQASGRGQVLALYVAPPWRRRYWGSKLAQALEEQLRAKGGDGLQVSLEAADWRQRRFWDAQGWSSKSITFAGP